MKHITPETDFAFADGAFSLRGEVAIQEPATIKPHVAAQHELCMAYDAHLTREIQNARAIIRAELEAQS